MVQIYDMGGDSDRKFSVRIPWVNLGADTGFTLTGA